MKNPGGWKREGRKFKDVSHRKLYGAAPLNIQIKPINRDISGISIVYQGQVNSCVSCSVTWIKQYLDKQKGVTTPLSHEYLAKVSGTEVDGATPSQVLDAAKKKGICDSEKWLQSNGALSFDLALNAAQHEIVGYAYLDKLTPQEIYKALLLHPVMIGVDDYFGSGPHMIAAYDVTEEGNLKCANWWSKGEQNIITIPFSDVKFAASILDEKPVGNVTIPPLLVLFSKAINLPAIQKYIATAIVALGSILGLAGAHPIADVPQETAKFGASGIADLFHPTISGSGMTISDTTVPVSSLNLGNGVYVTAASTTFPVYLVINPNSTADREMVECNGLSGTTFNGCYRQIAPICNNSTSTVQSITGVSGAFPHPAGETVIMSNNACFFNRFMDLNTQQTASGTKTFTQNVTIGEGVSSIKKLIFDIGQGSANPFVFANGTSSIGWSTNGVSTFLFNNGALVAASSSRGIFITNGLIGVVASSTPSFNGGYLNFSSDGSLYWDKPAFLASTSTFTKGITFNGPVTFNGTSNLNPVGIISGDGSDGDITLSSNATMTRDMYYNSLTVNANVTLRTNGYRLYSKSFINLNGIISAAGASGTNGGDGSIGVGGAAGRGGCRGFQNTTSSMAYGRCGENGGIGNTNAAGGDGASGSSTGMILVKSVGTAGGNGGAGINAGGNLGAGGTSLGTAARKPRTLFDSEFLGEIATSGTVLAYSTAPGNGGGGGGGARTNTSQCAGGGGGGGGQDGGFVFIATPLFYGNGMVTVTGGNGGTGGAGFCNGGSDGGGGGGGGGSGSGGIIMLIYSSNTFTGTMTSTAGIAGVGGTAATFGSSNPGSVGESGTNGMTILIGP